MRHQAVAFVVATATSTPTSSLSSSSRLGLLLLAAASRGLQAESRGAAAAAAVAVFGVRRFSSSSSSSSSPSSEEKRLPPRGAANASTFSSSSSTSSPPPPPPTLPLRSPTIAVWGADTGVGKTLVSAGLAAAAVHGGRRGVLFVKPVQTGFPADDDAAVVAGAAAAAAAADSAAGFPLVHGRHAAEAAAAGLEEEEEEEEKRSSFASSSSSSSSSSCSSPPSSALLLRRAVTQHAWRLPASPHAAVALEGRGVSDSELAAELAREIGAWEDEITRRDKKEEETNSSSSPRPASPLFDSLVLAETAGGTLSPSPSGNLQADAWRPLRLPALLVASPRLGGVSATLAAAESLVSRGHGAPVAAVVLAGEEDDESSSSRQEESDAIPAGHVEALERHLRALGVPLVVLPRACAAHPPPAPAEAATSPSPPLLLSPRPPDPALAAWLRAALPGLSGLLDLVDRAHAERLKEMKYLASDAASVFWWPFTQHSDLILDDKKNPDSVFAIDARAGEHFVSIRPESAEKGMKLSPFYDACASWWTQGAAGADPASSARLARALAAAAARYGHVIHPEAAHEPGVRAAKLLLGPGGPGRGWASRVFWSDNGSTAVEVGLKMAFRASRQSRAERVKAREEKAKEAASSPPSSTSSSGSSSSSSSTSSPPPVVLLALSGGYHGDTLGAMDATEPSVFNGEAQTPWYRGRGLFLEPPTCGMERGGEWRVRWLDGEKEEGEKETDSDLSASKGRVVDEVGKGGLAALFSQERLRGEGGGGKFSELKRKYKRHISSKIAEFENDSSPSSSSSSSSSPAPIIGAFLFEPCLQGAGGMRLVDPAFQVALCEVARELKIPVVADEVFSGLWRLGAVSGCELLGIKPDVACYAKLLTGGTIPLAATLATPEVFESFAQGGKANALLHGHSYSAHAVGCAAACESLRMLSDPLLNPSVCFSSGSGGGGGGGGFAGPLGSSERESSEGASSPQKECRGGGGGTCVSTPACAPGSSCGRLLPLWDQELLEKLAGHTRVRRAHAIGTVLAVELREKKAEKEEKRKEETEKEKGNYTATASSLVAASLRARGVYARPLGDVVYLMVTPVSAVGVGQGLQRKLLEALDDDEK